MFNPLKSTAKQRIIETERENSRIYSKMKTVSSQLGRIKLASEYSRCEQIKNRIARYVQKDRKVQLK